MTGSLKCALISSCSSKGNPNDLTTKKKKKGMLIIPLSNVLEQGCSILMQKPPCSSRTVGVVRIPLGGLVYFFLNNIQFSKSSFCGLNGILWINFQPGENRVLSYRTHKTGLWTDPCHLGMGFRKTVTLPVNRAFPGLPCKPGTVYFNRNCLINRK